MSSNEQIEFELKRRFYYIQYPDGEDNYIWTDREGKIYPLNLMSLDHLKASINLVKRDIENFKSSYSKGENNKKLMYALLPLAESKQKELEREFKNKTSL